MPDNTKINFSFYFIKNIVNDVTVVNSFLLIDVTVHEESGVQPLAPQWAQYTRIEEVFLKKIVFVLDFLSLKNINPVILPAED